MRLNTNNSASKMSYIDHQFTPNRLRDEPYNYQTTQPLDPDRFKSVLSDYNQPKDLYARSRPYNSTAAPQKLIGQMIATGQMPSHNTLKASSLVRDNSQGNYAAQQSPPPISSYNMSSLYSTQKKTPFVINNNSNNYYINMYLRSGEKANELNV